MSGPEKYLTGKQCAERLQMSERTLANWRVQGKGPPFVKKGRVRYPESELVAWMREGLCKSTSEYTINPYH